MRVVSLVPSATETLRAWGIDPVACTRFCEQPDLPTVGGTKNPDVAAIAALAADLVVVDEEENRRDDHEALVAAGLDVHVLAIRSVVDLDEQLPGLAARVGGTWEPLGATPAAALRAAVVVPIWRRPWMLLGAPTFGSSLLAALGIAVHPADAGPYPESTAEQIAASGVDAVLVPSEPYTFTDEHLAELGGALPTIRVDGQDLFWWGARTRGAMDRLRATLAELG